MKKIFLGLALTLALTSFIAFSTAQAADQQVLGCKGSTNSIDLQDLVHITSVTNGKVFLDAEVIDITRNGDVILLETNKSEDSPDVTGGRAKIRVTIVENQDEIVSLKVEVNEGLASLFKWYESLSCTGDQIKFYGSW